MVEDFSTRISNRNLKLKSPLKTIVGRDHKWRKNAKNFLLRETTQRILLKLDFTQTKGKNQYWQNSLGSKKEILYFNGKNKLAKKIIHRLQRFGHFFLFELKKNIFTESTNKYNYKILNAEKHEKLICEERSSWKAG